MPFRYALPAAAALAMLSAPTLARAPDRPITNREPDAMDVARTPMTDLNLSRREIPALLAEAERRPYALTGLETCSALQKAVSELDAILGPDIDLPQEERRRISEGRVAQWVIARFIPFRGLVREISGANKQERELGEAIQAGVARRGFLKGVGAARRCRYPASPATETIIAQHRAALATEDAERSKKDRDEQEPRIEADAQVSAETAPSPEKRKVIFTSEPVVQPMR